MRNSRGKGFIIIVFAGLIVVLLIFSLYRLFYSAENQATEAVHQFYSLEQDGTFSESWELFHPLMQQKFDKAYYIQDRAHVFMNHFGVSTFSYSLSDATKVSNWMMDSDTEPIDEVFHFTVYQTYKGKYGKFTIAQDVYVTEVKDEWKILWNYNK
ncbi:hypothetical protein [Tenuibacillus multivorans]|uniref:DUF4829 domain-containing protein n=1 Tax=Tenuibacillus multivorans TaxID=237069 RepID=A0A1G9X0Q6_9BACI|nr:hypothetical protein [Tenuibacillus multivorans]GEL77286.1 hypothetical protein TMU01_15210 [Tenuibacillus multivorans]SDM89973.1 hypothetical protein SAMN05216498_0954 [Tenuibacillus multivorans]